MRNLLKQDAQPQGDSTTVYIYGLVDPTTGYVRYVGKSNVPRYRLRVHLTPRELRPKTHKNHWLRGLLAQGVRPNLILLEKVKDFEWGDAERRWISYYRSIPGYPPLTNGTDGGDGVNKGTVPSDETRRKLSEKRRARKIPPLTDQHKQKIAAANRIAWQNFSEEERFARLKNLRPKVKKEKPPQPPKIKRTHRVYPDKSNCSSRFRGVSYYRVGKPWHAFCSLNGKLRHLGCFDVEEDAAKAFDRFVVENNILDARTNFPRSAYPTIPPPQ